MTIAKLMLVGFLCLVPSSISMAQDVEMTLPKDVAIFKQRRDLCDHFRGEEPFDQERRKFLEENLNKYCTGTDKELAALKAQYKNDAAVIKVLGQYEEKVEASSFGPTK